MFKAALILPAAAIISFAFAFTGCGSQQCPAGPPIAADDRAITGPEMPVALPIVVNDDACGTAALDLQAIDLDPSAPGMQLSITTDQGGYMLDNLGDVHFVPAAGFSGEAMTTYTIADSDGQVSAPARILVTVQAD
ncbi:MAG TPA: Ig-like domain-containing protein [Polyangia bacterium]|nr:Ig-like domain-containing protein [Polyangia bacterium]